MKMEIFGRKDIISSRWSSTKNPLTNKQNFASFLGVSLLCKESLKVLWTKTS